MPSNGNPQRLTTHPPLKRASLRYPVPPAKINLETLRGITHMRPRTTVIGAVMRIRNSLAYATHTFFQTAGFMYVHAPLITGADCEGAGEMFQVTTMDVGNAPKTGGAVDYTQACASLSLSLRPSLLSPYSLLFFPTHSYRDLTSTRLRLASHLHTYLAGLLWQARVPHCVRAAQRRVLRMCFWFDLYIWADLPCRELEHDSSPRRVLDDRAGDRVL